ncbi:MAG: cytosine permease [Actinobacteria bacterium]|nr:cytosine permease [Actinomycetota bacterium]
MRLWHGHADFAPEAEAEERAREEEAAHHAVGVVESRSVEYIPERERHGRPRGIFWILFGGDLALSIVVVGWLPIAFGLSWWASVTALLAGTTLGSIILAPMGLFGPLTGTNNPVSSGAHFGVVGRIIGSVLSILGAVCFCALAIWTGGDALIAAGARLFGLPDSDLAFAVGYALIAVIVMTIAIYGYASLVAFQKWLVPTVGVIFILGAIALAGKFDPGYGGAPKAYALGSFFPTWVLAAVIAMSTILSYCPFVGDWARYISPRRHSKASVVGATGIGAFVGFILPFLFGAYSASLFTDASAAYVPGLVAVSPTWYVVGILIVGVVGGGAQGGIGIYGTGLDFSSLVPRLSRTQATALFGGITIAIVYLGNFVFNMIDSISAFLVLLIILVVPWAVIMLVGYVYRRGVYYPDDLQVFNRRERGGRYWFARGYNVRAIVAWAVGSGVGLLFPTTQLYTGPLADTFSGVDVSFLVAGALTGVVYLLLLLLFPEPRAVFGPAGPRFGAGAERDSLPLAATLDAEPAAHTPSE